MILRIFAWKLAEKYKKKIQILEFGFVGPFQLSLSMKLQEIEEIRGYTTRSSYGSMLNMAFL